MILSLLVKIALILGVMAQRIRSPILCFEQSNVRSAICTITVNLMQLFIVYSVQCRKADFNYLDI